jgi:signal transduction histidine kinase
MTNERIMIVEDERIIADDIQITLEDLGYTVPCAAASGKDAIDKAEKHRPDLVLMDIVLQGEMDGIDAAKQIYSRFDIPIIYLTAYADESVLERAKKTAPFGYIIKPFEDRELHSGIETALFKHKMERELKQKNVRLEQSIKELKSTQQQLIQAEKMASLGQLATSVAHEINNPLGYISNNFDIILRYSTRLRKFIKKCEDCKPIFEKGTDVQRMAFLEETQELRKEIKLDVILDDIEDVIEESNTGIERIKNIVSSLNVFAHIDGKPIPANLNNIIEDILVVVSSDIKYKAKLIKKYGDIPEVMCYPQQLGQVFITLLTNAAYAIEGRGIINIKTYKAEKNVCVEIKDTGKGIPEELQEKIFEPFFTTKEPGKGTGLGLTVAYNVIEKHCGKIKVSSKVGEGTTFTIVLPTHG